MIVKKRWVLTLFQILNEMLLNLVKTIYTIIMSQDYNGEHRTMLFIAHCTFQMIVTFFLLNSLKLRIVMFEIYANRMVIFNTLLAKTHLKFPFHFPLTLLSDSIMEDLGTMVKILLYNHSWN
jgi:hypothetical protein